MSLHGQPYQWMLSVNPSLLVNGFKSAQEYHTSNHPSEYSCLWKTNSLKSETASREGRYLGEEWGHSQILIDPKKDYKGALISKILFSINNKLKRQNPSIYLILRNSNTQRKLSKFSRHQSKEDNKKTKMDSSMCLLKKKDSKEPTRAQDLKASSKKLNNPMRNTLHSLMQKLPEKKTNTNLNRSVPSESFELSLIEAREELSFSNDQDFHSKFLDTKHSILSDIIDTKQSHPTNCSNFSSKGAPKIEIANHLQSFKHTRDKSGDGRLLRTDLKSPDKSAYLRGENSNPKPCNNLKSVLDSNRRNLHHKVSESFELTCSFRDVSEELAIRSTDKKENSFSFLKQKETPKGKKPRKYLGDFLITSINNRDK